MRFRTTWACIALTSLLPFGSGCKRNPSDEPQRPAVAVDAATGTATAPEVEAADPQPPGDQLNGIYALRTLTRNAAGCDAEGPSVRESETHGHLLVSGRDVAGRHVVSAVSCGEVADCRAKLAAMRNGDPVPFHLSFGFDRQEGDRLRGEMSSIGTGLGETCSNAELRAATLVREGDTLRLEERTRRASYPAEDGRTCTTVDANRALAGSACAELAVLTAQLAEPL